MTRTPSRLAARVSRRPVIAGLAAAPLLPLGALAGDPVPATPEVAGTPGATPGAGTGAGWPSYGADISGRRAVTGTGITSASVADLVPAWTFEVGGPVSATPVISGGVVYVGSYDGALYAIDGETGESVWTYETGAAVLEPNLGIDLGVPGSAAVDGDTVYVGDAAAMVHAIDAATGEARWSTLACQQESACIWSSPVIHDGTVYVGVASIAKEAGFRGSVVAMDAATGEIAWQTFMVPEGVDGAGVFAVPAIDPDRGLLFVGTQNAYSEAPAPYGEIISIVALDMATGELAWSYAAPPNDGETAPTEDVGLSASPNLFTVTIDGTERDLVGEGQKSGVFWALDRDTGEVVWQAQVSPAGFLGGMEGSSAVAGDLVVVPATDWPEFDGPATGLVTALDAATGEPAWTVTRDAPVASPAAVADDVVFQAGFDGLLVAYALEDGTELWRADLGGSASGGIGVGDGLVVVGAATPLFAPFIIEGNTVAAYRLP